MTREDRAERRHAKRVANYKALQREKERKDTRGPVIAKFAHGFTSIKLYANGEIISSKHGSGSVIGATATVEQSGSARLLQDTRQSYLTIEGPRVSMAAQSVATAAQSSSPPANSLLRSIASHSLTRRKLRCPKQPKTTPAKIGSHALRGSSSSVIPAP